MYIIKKVTIGCLFSIIFLNFISCSRDKTYEIVKKGKLKIIKNKNMPNNPDFSLIFTEEKTIPFKLSDSLEFRSPTAMVNDQEHNIFMADFQNSKIHKFDKEYNYLKSFGGKGTGPGEFSGGPVTLALSKGRIITSCIQRENVLAFNTDGTFLKNLPQSIWCSFSHGQLGFNGDVVINQVTRRIDGNETAVSSSLNILKDDLSGIAKTLYTHEARAEKRVLPLRDMHVRFAAGDNLLYVGEISKDKYSIFAYNKDYEKVMEIRKSYITRTVDDPKAQVYMFQPNSTGGGFYPKDDTTWKNRDLHYKSVNYLLVDKKGRLWVVSPEKNINSTSGLYVDVFENGIYLNTINLPFFKGNNFTGVWVPVYLLNNKLFYVDREEEVVKVYNY